MQRRRFNRFFYAPQKRVLITYHSPGNTDMTPVTKPPQPQPPLADRTAKTTPNAANRIVALRSRDPLTLGTRPARSSAAARWWPRGTARCSAPPPSWTPVTTTTDRSPDVRSRPGGNSSVPATHVSEGAAPCPYCLAPRPNCIAPCPNSLAPCALPDLHSALPELKK